MRVVCRTKEPAWFVQCPSRRVLFWLSSTAKLHAPFLPCHAQPFSVRFLFGLGDFLSAFSAPSLPHRDGSSPVTPRLVSNGIAPHAERNSDTPGASPTSPTSLQGEIRASSSQMNEKASFDAANTTGRQATQDVLYTDHARAEPAAPAGSDGSEPVSTAAGSTESNESRDGVDEPGIDISDEGVVAPATAGQALPPGYVQMVHGHGHPTSAGTAYGHSGPPPGVVVGAEGQMWPPARAYPHPGFHPYSAAAAYGYSFGAPPPGYATAPPHASQVMSGTEGYPSQGSHSAAAHAAAAHAAAAHAAAASATPGGSPQGQSKASSQDRRIPGGFPAGASTPLPNGGIHGYGMYGSHPAYYHGQAARSAEAGGGGAASVSPNAAYSVETPEAGKAQVGDGSDGQVDGNGQGHDEEGSPRQPMSPAAAGTASPRSSAHVNTKADGGHTPTVPGQGYPPGVMSMHARHAYAHNAHMQAQLVAAQAAAAAAAAGAAAAGVGGGPAGAPGGDRLMYTQPPPGGLYMHESHMHHQYQRGGRSAEQQLRSPAATAAGGVPPNQHMLSGGAHGAQREAYAQYRLPPMYEPHAQGGRAQQPGSQASPRRMSREDMQPNENLGSSSSATSTQGW